MSVPPPIWAPDALGAALDWIAALVTGSLASSLAVVAVAWTGFGMLHGRVSVRAGIRMLLGCFVVFGSNAIAGGLMSLAQDNVRAPAARAPAAPPPPQPLTKAPDFDPYAGASVPN